MKLRTKFVVIFLGISVIPIAVVIGLSIWSVRSGEGNDLTGRLLSVGFILIMLGIFFALQFAKYIADPIISVARAATKLREGQLAERVGFHSRDELGELAESFNQMASQIERVDTAKSNFIDIASHHLRTPETIINSSVEELVRSSADLNKEQMNYIELIRRGSSDLHDINETLLTISNIQIGNASPNVQKVPLPEMLHELVAQFADDAQKRAIALSVEPAATAINAQTTDTYTVQLDPQLLRVALRSLLRNALLFTQHGSVRMSLEAGSNFVNIHITDTGIGIPAEDLPSLFGKFFQAKNGKSVYPAGKGLGLYLAQICIKALGGEIRVASTLGKGSVFTVKLPRQA
jgi:signal transduction histidine kinase